MSRARGQREGEANGGAEIARRGRDNFMQGGRCQAALQHGIDPIDAERERPRAHGEVGFLTFDFRHR